jgi:hypothetical protein
LVPELYESQDAGNNTKCADEGTGEIDMDEHAAFRDHITTIKLPVYFAISNKVWVHGRHPGMVIGYQVSLGNSDDDYVPQYRVRCMMGETAIDDVFDRHELSLERDEYE